jgi:hypothetical protein
MRAKITKAEGYTCAPQGSIVVTFPYGTEVEGRVAEMALADHAASRMFERETKVSAPTETKVKKKPVRKPRK